MQMNACNQTKLDALKLNSSTLLLPDAFMPLLMAALDILTPGFVCKSYCHPRTQAVSLSHDMPGVSWMKVAVELGAG